MEGIKIVPHTLIELLERFNRKERFFLVGDALGNDKFTLSVDFRRRLNEAIGLKQPIPECSFAAMDYHIDWVVGALERYASDDGKVNFPNKVEGDARLVTGNQQDIDFLVAFEDDGGDCHLIFLEAKAYTAWNSEQLLSKVKRLDLIFRDNIERSDGVKPHLCLVSPSCPSKIDTGDWPKWCLKRDSKEINWLKLKVAGKRLRVTRWSVSEKKPSQNGSSFRVVDA